MTFDSTHPPYEEEFTADRLLYDHKWASTAAGRRPVGDTFRLMLDRLLAERPRARMADIGCGTGRHTLAAAAAGLCVTAVDHNATAVSLLRERLPDPHLVDVRQINMGRCGTRESGGRSRNGRLDGSPRRQRIVPNRRGRTSRQNSCASSITTGTHHRLARFSPGLGRV